MINTTVGTADDANYAACNARHNDTLRVLLRGYVTDWFPLLSRTRPPGQALHRRVDEIRELAHSLSQESAEIRLSSAAEVLNKAALIASDCDLVDLARQLCWRQFDVFNAATPLSAKTAKLALQPIVNLGRLATRSGEGTRAYRIFENAYEAVTTKSTTEIDGKDIDFQNFMNQTGECQEPRRFLWTILLADGTRAFTTAGLWDDALRHIEQYKGIGRRMLDGRQVAILARCATGDFDTALEILDASSTPEPWEEAVSACLRTLCLRIANRQAEASAAAMARAYLRLEPTREHLVFRTRLGLCAINLSTDTHQTDSSQVITRVIREAVAGADAYSAREVLSHGPCRSSMTETDRTALAHIVELSGLRRGSMPADLLNDLMASAKVSETQLAQTLRSARGCLRGS